MQLCNHFHISMCLAIPGQVVEINGRKATVKYPSVTNFALIGEDNIKVGDWVMVQMGIVIKKLEEKEALLAQETWK